MRTSIPLILLVVTILRSSCAWAAVVTTTGDSGPGSLRQAITDATPGETLTFAVTGPITLTSGELLITTNLTITGPGASQLTVERSTAAGTPDFRIFNIRSGIVTCSGLTVNNGRADSGGGILNQARGNLKLQDMVISGNTATNAGGGIKNVGTLTLDGVVITGNTAGDGSAGKSGFGGGLDNEDFVIVINSRIDNNRAVGGANADGIGGGINNSTTALLMNSTVNGNRAEGGSGGGNASGGGINNSSGTMTNFDCTISGNAASGGAGSVGGGAQGGGIADDSGTVHLERCTVSGNSATGGSGSTGAGGPSDGGGVANGCGSLTLETSTVSGNSATPGAGTPGPGTPPSGGVFNGCGTTTLNHSTITTNTAAEGSAVFNNLGSSLELKNTIVAGNAVTFDFFSVESDTIASGGFNLIGRTNILISPGPSDRFNITAAELKLGPLQDNGGPTFTHALLCGSLAIDTGDNTDAPETDQRGMPRIVRRVIDIGAYEDSNTAPTVLCPAPVTLTANSSTGLVATVSVQVADADGDGLNVILSVGGVPLETRPVAVSGPSTPTNVSFTNFFALGTNSILFQVSDTKQCEATCSTTLVILAPNTAPVARPDGYSVNEDTILTIPAVSGVLTNDSDADADALTAVLVSGPTNALAFTLNSDGSFSYTPATNYFGPDSFTYRANDGLTNSAVVTVSLNVMPVNDAPVARPDSYSVNEDTILTVPAAGVLTNDSDADADALTAVLVSGPTNALAFTLNSDGSFSYTPATNYFGPDSFTYQANDGLTNSAPVTVSLNVMPVNDAPVARPDSYSVNEDTILTVPAVSGVLTNDSDVDADALTAVLVSGPTHALAFTLNPDGSFSYTPATNYFGPDSFTYRANDGLTNSAPVTVSLNVMPVNDAPVARPDSYSVNEDTILTVPAVSGVLTNDSDAEADALTAVLVSGPTHALAFSLNPDGSFNYTPATNYFGPDSFTYQANDGLTNSAPVTVRLTVTPTGGQGCELYPIALHQRSLKDVPVGTVIHDIYNGVQPGNFGWLTWFGSPNEPTLVRSLTPPGDSKTYSNPNDRNDHVVSVGDWVQGKPGISNSDKARAALDALKQIDITVPVWDQVRATGNNSLYRVVAFARVRLVSYQLPRQNRISAQFLGLVNCQ